jgi:hypothetical protein
MRKALLILAFLSFPLLAFHNLVIKPDSARIGIDTLWLTGAYEHTGDTASIVGFFKDNNHNGVFDAGIDNDFLGPGKSFQIIDGNKTAGGDGPPPDTVADGLLSMPLTTGGSPFNSPGYFVFIFAGGGIADTAGFKLIQVKTSTFITGKITDPSGNPARNIGIRGRFYTAVPQNKFGEMSATTDTLGMYAMYMDSTYRGKRVTLEYSTDMGSAFPSTWIVFSSLDTLLVDSLKNIDFAFTAAAHFVKGVAQDEKGLPVKAAPCYLQDSTNTSINFTTDSLGRFLVGVNPGRYSFYLETWNFAGFLTNDRNNQIMVGGTIDTLRFTWVLHSTDTSISGTVTDDSSALNKGELQVEMSAAFNDTMYRTTANIRAAGAYKVAVSTFADTYAVQARTYNLPNKFYVYPQRYPSVHYGSMTCNFSIVKGVAAISGRVQDTLNNCVGDAQVWLIDTAQKLFFSVQFDNNNCKFTQFVPAGKYMVSFFGYSNGIGRDVAGAVGPIVITASSTDTFVTCIARPAPTFVQRNQSMFMPVSFGFSKIQSPTSQAFAFSTPIAGKARLLLFDIRGRLVGAILNRDVSAGSYRVNWDSQSRLYSASQTYIAVFDFFGAKQFHSVQKFILTR